MASTKGKKRRVNLGGEPEANRGERIPMRVSASEKALFTGCALSSELTLSEWLRQAAVEKADRDFNTGLGVERPSFSPAMPPPPFPKGSP